MQQIPVVDLAPARTGDLRARQAVARRIDDICREVGFFTITGHGVSPNVMDSLRAHAHAFFALPLEEKRKAINPVPDAPRGYRALGIEALAQANEQAIRSQLQAIATYAAVTVSPTWSSPASSRNSARCFDGGASALRRWPSSALDRCFSLHAPKASWTAS